MTKEEIFNYFYTNNANLGINATLLVLAGGLLIGAIIYLVYWFSYKGVAYNRNFNMSLVVILEIAVVIMLMISSNIVISLGMVGALSIVRFRTAIKDSKDTVYIFWAIAEGLCVGSQNFKLAIITTLFIGIIILLFDYLPKIYNKYLLIVAGDDELDSSNITTVLNRYVTNTKISSNNITEKHQELIIEVRTKGEINQDLVSDLMDVKGIKSVNYIIESGETIG